MTAVYVAAGSNVEPIANLRRALGALAAHYPGLRVSRAWRNRAVGFDGDDFVNLAVGFDTDDDVQSVLGLVGALAASGTGAALCGAVSFARGRGGSGTSRSQGGSF